MLINKQDMFSYYNIIIQQSFFKNKFVLMNVYDNDV